jgi:hypothetical protein
MSSSEPPGCGRPHDQGDITMGALHEFIIRFTWRTGQHLVQVIAATLEEARLIVQRRYPGCVVDSARSLS